MNILEYAIKMEKKDMSYYKKQAKKNRNNCMNTIYNLLADEEKKHAKLLSSIAHNSPYKLEYTDTCCEIMNAFQNDNDFESVKYDLQEKLDICREELERKSESIHVYKNLLMKSLDNENRDVITYLITLEKQQYRVFQSIIKWMKKLNAQQQSSAFAVRINTPVIANIS